MSAIHSDEEIKAQTHHDSTLKDKASPDQPQSLNELASTEEEDRANEVALNKKHNGGLGPVSLIFACGTALFSDGYVNANSGPTNTIIRRIYANTESASTLTRFSSLYSSLTFAGTLLGECLFTRKRSHTDSSCLL